MSRVTDPVDNTSVGSSGHVPGEFPASGVPQATVSSQLSLSQALYARRAEYTRPHTVRVKVGTWNVAAFKGTEKDLGGWFVGGKGVSEVFGGLSIISSSPPKSSNDGKTSVDLSETLDDQEQRSNKRASTLPKNDPGTLPGGEEVGLYALGLQEVVDISSATEALRPFADSTPANKFKKAVEEALPPGYQLVAEQQLIGLLLLIYASPSVAPQVSSVSTTSVGTGLMGYMGNKGAVTSRIVLGESTRLVFINAHMSAGTGLTELDRRNWDASQILSRTRFEPVVDSLGGNVGEGEKVGDEDFAFWFGDLNYRLEGVPPQDVRRLLMLHTAKQYRVGSNSEKLIEKEIAESITSTGKSSKDSQTSNTSHSSQSSGDTSGTEQDAEDDSEVRQSTVTLEDLEDEMNESSDPASLLTTINSLLPHDELRQQQKAKRMFHDGWREGPITFLPTYKYDVGKVSVFDSGEKKRGPSWCDRILYRTRKDRIAYEKAAREEAEAKKRDNDMKAQGVDKAAEDEEMLFDYDPDADGENEEETVAKQEEYDPHTFINEEGVEDMIALEFYTSHQRVLSSDHKPLEAVFTLKYDAALPELKSKVQEEVARELDRAENEGRPILTIVGDGGTKGSTPERDGVDFGEIRYMESKTRSLTLANTGGSPAQFGFVNRDFEYVKDPSPTPAWLEADIDLQPHWDQRNAKSRKSASADDEWTHGLAKAFTLEPGETCSLFLTAVVETKDLLRALNFGQELDDVLILRVKDGRDHFLTVKATWLKTSHGHTIDRLIRIPEGGVRKLQRQHPSRKSKSPSRRSEAEGEEDNGDSSVMWSAPREILKLTEAIETLVERLVAEYSMLGDAAGHRPPWETHAGWPFDPESWTLPTGLDRTALQVAANEALDSDQPFSSTLPVDLPPSHRLEVLSQVLLAFLANLSDGVVTPTLYATLHPRVLRAGVQPPRTREEKRAAALEVLSARREHSVVFVLVTSMLARVATEVSSATTSSANPAPPASPATAGAGILPNPFAASPASPTTPSPRAKQQQLPSSSPKVGHRRRRTLDADPAVARRQLVRLNYAALFAEVLVRHEDEGTERESGGGGAKAKKEKEADARELVELFLDTGTAG